MDDGDFLGLLVFVVDSGSVPKNGTRILTRKRTRARQHHGRALQATRYGVGVWGGLCPPAKDPASAGRIYLLAHEAHFIYARSARCVASYSKARYLQNASRVDKQKEQR